MQMRNFRIAVSAAFAATLSIFETRKRFERKSMPDPAVRTLVVHSRNRRGTRANNRPGMKRPLARSTPYVKLNYRRSHPMHLRHFVYCPDAECACWRKSPQGA